MPTRTLIRSNRYAPCASNLYFLQFPALACEALAPVLALPAIPGRSLPSTPPQARRQRKLPTHGHRCSRQSRPSRSAGNRMSTLPGAKKKLPTILRITRRTSSTSSMPAARPISGRLRVRYVSVSFLIAHRGALSTTSLSKPMLSSFGNNQRQCSQIPLESTALTAANAACSLFAITRTCSMFG